ncbi:clumping factor A-like [Gigantopelta aegis]|uniref:clumping factor A-like n=1 Tax=Gigantopelta aegis TaxID=1735272 RepID=UPI001B8885EF|nr:clumping factor A-like [Gigantopelta aegis]
MDDLETVSNLSSSAETKLEPENEGTSNSDSKTQPQQGTTMDDLETVSNLSSSAGTTLEPENEGISNSDSKTQPQQGSTMDDLETVSNLSSSAGTTLEPENEGISNSDSKTQLQQDNHPSETPKPDAAPGIPEQNPYDDLEDTNNKGEAQDKKPPHESNPYSALGAREEKLYECIGDQTKTEID